jgi:hypothetical protein
MTNRDAGLLTFKALSIYAMIMALEQTEWILYRWDKMPPEAGFDTWIYLDLFAPFLLLIMLSVVLWLGATRLSNRIFINSNQITEASTISLNDIKNIIFLSIGLYLLVNTISPLIQTISSVYASLTNAIDPSSRRQVTMLRITTTLKIGMGLWLIFGNKGLTNILKKIRNE